jgi:hypothetical protein
MAPFGCKQGHDVKQLLAERMLCRRCCNGRARKIKNIYMFLFFLPFPPLENWSAAWNSPEGRSERKRNATSSSSSSSSSSSNNKESNRSNSTLRNWPDKRARVDQITVLKQVQNFDLSVEAGRVRTGKGSVRVATHAKDYHKKDLPNN